MKIFNQDIGINLDDKAKQGMIQELYKKRIQIKTGIHANANFPHKPWSFTDFPKLATEIKITDPNIEFDVNEIAWDGMRQELEGFRDDNNWYAFAQQAMQMKILDPNIDLGLNQDAWDGMRSRLKTYGGGTGWIMFSGQAVAMKILAAEEVKVTDKGLEINMRKKKDSLTSDVPPIPEIKKF